MSETPPFAPIPPEEYEKITEPYRLAIGEVALAWNGLQEELGNLFWLAIGTENGRIPLAIWHSTYNDRTQREMLRAAVNARWPDDKRTTDSFKLLLDECNTLANKRNDALHAPFDFLTHHDGTHSFKPSVYSLNPRARNLGETDLLNKLDWYSSIANVLRHYAFSLFLAIAFPSHNPWPEKLELPRFSPSPIPKQPRHKTEPK